MSKDLAAYPDLQETYDIPADQIAYYRKNGHVMLRGVASDREVAAYRQHLNEKVQELNQEKKKSGDPYAKSFIQIINVWLRSEIMKKFVHSRRFANIAADLMGVDRVRVYHDQALFKEPRSGITQWHQDQVYWPLDTDNTVTMWMPFVPIPEEVGSMLFASGSHREGLINRLTISDESHKTLKQYIEAKAFEVTGHGGMAPGDATFHAGWTLHSAPDNPLDYVREVMTIIYFADGAKVVEPDTQARRNSLEKRFPGCVSAYILPNVRKFIQIGVLTGRRVGK